MFIPISVISSPLREMPMFKVESERVLAVLKLLPIISLERWTIKVITDCIGFIGDFVAFSAYSKAKISVVLTGQVLIPAARLFNNRLFQQQVHGCYATQCTFLCGYNGFLVHSQCFLPMDYFCSMFLCCR